MKLSLSIFVFLMGFSFGQDSSEDSIGHSGQTINEKMDSQKNVIVVTPDAGLAILMPAIILTNDGQEYEVFNVFTQNDSLFATDKQSGSLLEFHYLEIRYLDTKNRWKGALKGSLYGGAGLGLAARVFVGPAQSFYSPLFLIPPGALMGFISGYAIGSPSKYIFDHNRVSLDSSTMIGDKSTTHKPRNVISDRSERVYRESKYQIAGGLFQKSISKEGLYFSAGGQLRRTINLPQYFRALSALNESLGGSISYHLGLSIQVFSGNKRIDGRSSSWGGEMYRVYAGLEKQLLGTADVGSSGLFELSLATGSIYRHDYEYPDSYSNSGYVDLLVGMGAKSWFHILFGEVQIQYALVNNLFLPNLVLGLRF